jgi:hypothetical protein
VLLLASEQPQLTKSELVNYIWGFENGIWMPQYKTIPPGSNFIRLLDTTTRLRTDLFEIIINEEDGTYSPILGVSTGLTVKKDISAGGFVSANQGLIVLGSGMQSPFDPPGAWMIHSHNKKINFKGTSPPSNAQVGWRWIRTDQPVVSGNATFYKVYEYRQTSPGTYGWVQLMIGNYEHLSLTDTGYAFGNNRPNWGSNEKNQWFIQTYTNADPPQIYQWNGIAWSKGYNIDEPPFAGFFDTFEIRRYLYGSFLIQDDQYAHLKCANITAHNTNPSKNLTYGLGSPEYRWLGICTETVYTNAIKSLNGNSVTVNDPILIRYSGQAGGQLKIENTLAGGGVLSIGVGDNGLSPYLAWFGSPYGTNSINNFAYGMFIGLFGQSAILLQAKWGNAEKMRLNQSGTLTLAGGLTTQDNILIANNEKFFGLRNGATRLYSDVDGILKVQNATGQLSTLYASNIYVDHLNSATGQGIYLMDTLKPHGSAINIAGRVDSTGVIHAGGGSGDAFQVGDDILMVDVNNANRLSLQGMQDRAQAGIQFGSGGPYIYRDSNYMRVGAGWIVDGYIVAASWANTSQYGPLYRNSSGQIGYNTSSKRYKENIEPVKDCSWVYQLQPVTFEWKDDERAKAEGTQLGLIAEEVYKQCPQLIWLDNEGEPEGVHYEWLGIPLLVELKKLRKELNELKAKLTA